MMIDLYKDPFWELVDFFNDPFERKVRNCGLKNIKRPHNLVNVKDESGNVIAQKLTVVTTPFKKEDVKVSILDDVLTVECGSENVKDEKNEDVIYRGISSQQYEFSIRLGENIDQGKIKAENKDGMLTINMPLIPPEPAPERKAIEVTVG